MRNWVISFALLAATVQAADADSPFVIDVATQIAQSQTVETQHRIALSKVRRLSGQLALDRELTVAGALAKATYELPTNTDVPEAFAKVLASYGHAQLLYRCEGRDCGSSNLWANTVFNNARLYGVDDQQAYAVIREQNQLTTLYSVLRGNRRGYVHIETLQSDTPLGEILPEAATLTYQLQAQKRLDLGLTGEPSEAWVQLLTNSLRRQVTLRVAIGGPLAPLWRDALIAKGISAARLELSDQKSEFLFLEALR